MPRRRALVVLSIAAGLALGSAGVPAAGGAVAGGAQQPPRPDLRVTGGTVKLSHGRLTGSFTVSDLGRAPAGRSRAALTLTLGRRTRTLTSFTVPSLGASKHRAFSVSLALPGGLPAGSHPLTVCADSGRVVQEGSESNNCRVVGKVAVAAVPVITPGGAAAALPPPGTTAVPAPASTAAASAPVSTVPTDPVTYSPDHVFTLESGRSTYWVYVPYTYDPTNQTPSKLLVWLHGCGGEAAGDIYDVSPGGSQDWISIAVGGEEDQCWDVDTDGALVLAALANVRTHFNIDPRRVVLGGYSSGGDLGYRTAFYNSRDFAGLLIENSSPFRDTGSTQAQSLAAADWKFTIVQLAHLQDQTYPIAGVRTETDEVSGAGFPLTRIEVDGAHYDDPGAVENGHAVPGTVADLRAYLLPKIDAGWQAPAS